MSKPKQLIDEVLKGSDPKKILEVKNVLPLAQHLSKIVDDLMDLGQATGMAAEAAPGTKEMIYRRVESYLSAAVDKIELAMKVAGNHKLMV